MVGAAKPYLYDMLHSHIHIQISFHILLATDLKDGNIVIDSRRIVLHAKA